MRVSGRNRSAATQLRFTVAIVVVLALVLAACTGGTGGDEAAAGGGEGGADGGGGECSQLALWYLADHEVLVDQAVAAFNEEFPDVTVEAQGIENDPYKTQLQTVMGTPAAPDVFHSWGGGWLKQFADAGLLEPLDDYLAENSEWGDSLAQSGLETATYDDSVYAVPAILGGVYMWYRTDVFEEHGVEPPETYDELLEVVSTLNDAGVTPVTLANASMWPGSFYYMYLGLRLGGPDLYLDAYSRENDGSFAAPAYIEAGEMLQQLVDADAFPDGFNGLNYDTGESRALLWSGDAAMQLMGDWLLNAAREEAPEVEENLDFFPFPMVEGGEGDPSSMVGGVNAAYSVTAETDCPDEAKALAQQLTDTETAQTVVDEQLGTPAVQEGVNIEDPFQQRFVEALSEAEYVQPYYDQDLPPEVAQTHLETTQQLFGGSATPEQAAEQTEQAAQEALSEQ